MEKSVETIVDTLRSESVEGTTVWKSILHNLAKHKFKGLDYRYVMHIEDAISVFLATMDNKQKRALWKQTETGMMDPEDADNIDIASLDMDLEIALVDAVTNYACSEAKDLGA